MHPNASSIDKIKNKVVDIRNAAAVAGLAGLAKTANLYLANTRPQHSSLEILSLASDLEQQLRRAETEWAAVLRGLRTAGPTSMRGHNLQRRSSSPDTQPTPSQPSPNVIQL